MSAERFEAPWHAQLFALTVALSGAGHLSWHDWTAALGRALAQNGSESDADYYRAWLGALEEVLADLGVVEPELLEHYRLAWERAYLSTPHGQPVTMEAAYRSARPSRGDVDPEP